MKKMLILLLMVSILVPICGCGGKVDELKDYVLPAYKETTVGEAFEAVFVGIEWTLITTENGSQCVQFEGTPKDCLVVNSMAELAPDSKLKIQFIAKRDGTFAIGYTEAALSFIDPNNEVVKLAASLNNIEMDGKKMQQLSENGIIQLIESIYNF